MKKKIIIKCPSCKRNLQIPRTDNKLKVTCPHCSYKFESIPQKKNDSLIPNLSNIFYRTKKFFTNIKYHYFKYKHDPYYREKLNSNGTIAIGIVIGLLVINFLLKIIL